MPKVRVAGFAVSLDGFSAGTEQSLNDPLGRRGPDIFQWFFHTKTFCAMHGQEGGSIDLDDEFARRSMENYGAFILGRNMFGPVRGPWPDSSWKGWWGGNPPYHAETFVLTHYERESLVMEGGTTFHFVTGGGSQARKTGSGREGCQNWRRCFYGTAISASRADRFPALCTCTCRTWSRGSTVYRSRSARSWIFCDGAQGY